MTDNITYHTFLSTEEIKQAKIKYAQQKQSARWRKIEWKFTFDTWMEKWIENPAKWANRGRKKRPICDVPY